MNRYHHMLRRLFAWPIVTTFATGIFTLLLLSIRDQENRTSSGFIDIGHMFANAVSYALPYVFYGGILISVVLTLFKFWELYLWQQGKTTVCRRCGGLTELRTGRYGPYSRCLACSKTESL